MQTCSGQLLTFYIHIPSIISRRDSYKANIRLRVKETGVPNFQVLLYATVHLSSIVLKHTIFLFVYIDWFISYARKGRGLSSG